MGTTLKLAPALSLPVVMGAAVWAGSSIIPTQGLFILGVAAVAGYIGWLLTSFHNPVESKRVVYLYLAAVAVQVVHLGEEYLFGFAPRFSTLFDTNIVWSERSFLSVFVFGFVPLWILAALAMLSSVPVLRDLGNYFAWFYALGAGLINAVAHFVFPVLAGGYYPGLYTAPLHLVMSIVLIYALLKETKRVRDTKPGHQNLSPPTLATT